MTNQAKTHPTKITASVHVDPWDDVRTNYVGPNGKTSGGEPTDFGSLAIAGVTLYFPNDEARRDALMDLANKASKLAVDMLAETERTRELVAIK